MNSSKKNMTETESEVCKAECTSKRKFWAWERGKTELAM